MGFGLYYFYEVINLVELWEYIENYYLLFAVLKVKDKEGCRYCFVEIM